MFEDNCKLRTKAKSFNFNKNEHGLLGGSFFKKIQMAYHLPISHHILSNINMFSNLFPKQKKKRKKEKNF